MNKLPKTKSITLSVFHLPILIAIAMVAAVGVGLNTLNRKEQASIKMGSNTVLSDEDDRSESEDKEDDKKDEEEKSDSESRESHNEDSDKEDAKIEVRKSQTSTKTNTYIKTEIEDDSTENEADKLESHDTEDEEESLDKSEEKTELVTSVTNLDGTVTKTFRKTEGSEVELKALTYDQDGNLIKKAELNPDGTIKEEEIVGQDDNESESEDDNEFELVFKPSTDGTVDPNLSKILKAELKQEVESDTKLGTSVNKLELEVKTSQGTIKYEGTALKNEKLFGLFGIEIPVDLEVDPVTGKITAVNQTFWSKILDFFSI